MPKRVSAFELMLSTRDPETPAYRWIDGALRTETLESRLRLGSRLPSSRDLRDNPVGTRGALPRLRGRGEQKI
jgi:hypothetical protein